MNMKRVLLWACLMAMVSCTEEIRLDLEEGNPLVGIEASFTDELKCHEAILSYTSDFYQSDDIRMVSGATVYVTDGIDTTYYIEDTALCGHYYTQPVAGIKNQTYRLCVDVPDATKADGYMHIFAESQIPNNVEQIDSIVVKPYNGNDSLPIVYFGDTMECIYPYFQSLPDPSIVYMPLISKNDTLLTDTISYRMVIPIGGYAGYYINGPEMQMVNMEIPIYMFYKDELCNGDRIRVSLCSISPDYIGFMFSMMMSSGSNPMLGAPANVVSNIQPTGEAVGWFFTASVVSAETIYMDNY